jgi:hypothetical protein
MTRPIPTGETMREIRDLQDSAGLNEAYEISLNGSASAGVTGTWRSVPIRSRLRSAARQFADATKSEIRGSLRHDLRAFLRRTQPTAIKRRDAGPRAPRRADRASVRRDLSAMGLGLAEASRQRGQQLLRKRRDLVENGRETLVVEDVKTCVGERTDRRPRSSKANSPKWSHVFSFAAVCPPRSIAISPSAMT